MAQDDQLKTDWANLKKYAEENKKLSRPLTYEKRIVFIGDSITESWSDISSSFFTGNAYINRGISGQTTAQILARFQQDVIDLKPALVVILAGINDIAQNQGPVTIEAMFDNIISMTKMAKAHKIKVVLSSVLPAYDFSWRAGLQPAGKVIRLNNMIRSYCAANHLPYADYFSKMVDERNGLDKKLSEDGVHPNLAGYKIMEPIIQHAVKKALKQH